MNEFIDSLNLPIIGDMRGKQYYISVNNSNDFSSLFNAISLNDSLTLEENSTATVNESSFRFTNGEYDVILNADYDNDMYDMTIEVR